MAAQLTGFMLSGPTLALSLPASAAVSGQPGAQHAGGQLQAAGFSIWLGQAQAASAGASSISQAGGESLPQDGMQLPPFPVKNGKAPGVGDAREKGSESGSLAPGWEVNSRNLKLNLDESGANIAYVSGGDETLSDAGKDVATLVAHLEGDSELMSSDRDELSMALMQLLEMLEDESWLSKEDVVQAAADVPAREKLAELLISLSTLLEGMDPELGDGSGSESKRLDAYLLQSLSKDFDTRELQSELTAEQLARIEVALQQLQQALQQALQARPSEADMIADGRMLAREALEKVLELLSSRLAVIKEQGEIAQERAGSVALTGLEAQVERLQEALMQAQTKPDGAIGTAKSDAVPVNPLGVLPDKKSADMESRSQALGVSRTPESMQSSSVPPPLHERQAPLPTPPEQQSAERPRAAFVDQLLPQERSIDQRSSGEALKQSDVPQQSVRLESGLTSTPAQSTMAANSVPADATTAAKQAALAQQLQNPAWARAMGERAIMMTQQGPRFAEIRLDPPELGALKIRVHILPGDQVSLSFSSPNAAVRDALEQNMPRLREMFAEQGLNLMDSSVSDQAQEDRARQNAQRSGDYRSGDESEEMLEQGGQNGRRLGLVDYYA